MVFAKTLTEQHPSSAHGGDMGRFGRELRREREVLGISVEAICAITKVSPRHVLALEDGRFMALPGGVFRKGIIRSYLNAVGLDESTWIQRYESALRELGEPPVQEQDWVEFAENIGRSRPRNGPPTGLRWFGVVLMLLGLLALGWVTWRFVLRDRLAPAAAFMRPRSSLSFPRTVTMGKIKC